METIKLAKEITYDGEKVTQINLDFDALTGKDLLAAEKELKVQNTGAISSPVKEFDKEYLAIVGAKAVGMPTDFIYLLGAKDFTKLTLLVQGFLMGEE